ncbi:ABC transporter ATP-binding protein [Candidatus Caldatribacterium sp.]|uniref:ABC transporter ATP-binding protein n=1 Tax=Candidatus Caldatribacterium sp. TaxID=2282143 RepID=UPI0029923FAD|nr:ABC transporter ATP-binding protein [Candidatus Caldatribacterium sp.]MDW8081123.1 ABC transporter ATP-binding protein [Candidatus Calescibacterium sp.]
MREAVKAEPAAVCVEVENLQACYVIEQQGIIKRVKAVDGVSLNIRENSFLAIVGESGCGKTTLARVLYGAVNSNLLVIGGRVCYALGDAKYELSPAVNTLRAVWWEKISYIPQGSLSALNPIRKLRDIFFDLATSHNVPFEEQRVKAHLEMVKLPSYTLRMYPFELSGGMRQRAVIALATFLNPSVIIADEPTSALDVITQRDILRLLKHIQITAKSTFIFITHDIALVPDLADVVAIMYGGRIVEYGPVETVFSSPLHPYTRFLLSATPTIGDKTEKRAIPGTPVSLIDPPPGCRFHPRCPYRGERCVEGEPCLEKTDAKIVEHQVACWLYE